MRKLKVITGYGMSVTVDDHLQDSMMTKVGHGQTSQLQFTCVHDNNWGCTHASHASQLRLRMRVQLKYYL